jgi:hypothetical protein
VAIGETAKATGSRDVAIGRSAFASGGSSLSLGQSSAASGSNSLGIGRSANAAGYQSGVVGYSADATASRSFALGHSSISNIIGKYAYAGGFVAALGDSQTGTFVLRKGTTDATPAALSTDSVNATAGADDQIILPNNSAFGFSGTIIARQQTADGSNYASWEVKGALLRDANAASTVLGNGIINKLYATAGASAWAIALTADTTNGGLKIEATGAAATDIRWVATVNTSEVTYA